MDHGYLTDILILFAVAVAALMLLLRMRMPPILGYLGIGVLVGPYGLALISDTEHTRAFAEYGVVFLLFTIGLEFSLSQLARMKNAVLGLGASQVFLTTSVTAGIAMYHGEPFGNAVVLGGIVAMSSTALVTKQLTEQVELHTRHGKNAVGILLFQDIMVIPLLILVGSMASPSSDAPIFTVFLALAKGLLAVVAVLVLGRSVLRPLFRIIAQYRSTELFTLAVLLITLGSAWITHNFGLSLALGAFIAGMMLGETEFRHQVEAEIRPFRDVLLGLFFITIGMLLNLSLLPEIWHWVLLLVVALIAFKLLLITVLCRIAGWDNAVSLRTGLVMAHGGEFGFAVLALALSTSLFPADYGQVVLAALLFSMAIAPLFIRFNGRLVAFALPKAMETSQESIKQKVEDVTHGVSDHVILCGYGRVGQNIARLLEEEAIPYVALDTDPVLVQNAINAKEPVTYGDAANIELLKAAHLSEARAIVISLDDVSAARKILHKVRHIDTDIPILVRAADDNDLERLQNAGATEVIPETMEASLMIASHLLLLLEVPVSRVFRKIRDIRNNRYELLRSLLPGERTFLDMIDDSAEELRAIDLQDDMQAIKRTISALELQDIDVTVNAIQRGERRLIHPEPDTTLQAGDTLVLSGSPADLDEAELRLSRPE